MGYLPVKGSEMICMPYGIQQIQQHCMHAAKEEFV